MTSNPSSPAFAASPLITWERLQEDYVKALELRPVWANGGTFADPDLSFEEDNFIVFLGIKDPLKCMLAVPSAAILFELTRYGSKVGPNSNRAKGGTRYAKLIFAGHSRDNMPIDRIIMNARPRQSVRRSRQIEGDHHPSGLTEFRDGKPTKASRKLAIEHAVALVPGGSDAAAYQQNLWALCAYHDELFGLGPEY